MKNSVDQKPWAPATQQDIETVIARQTRVKEKSVSQTILEMISNNQGLVKEALIKAAYDKFNNSSGIAIARSDLNKYLAKKLFGLSIQRGKAQNEHWWIAIQSNDPTIEITKYEINAAIRTLLNLDPNPTSKPAPKTPTHVQKPKTIQISDNAINSPIDPSKIREIAEELAELGKDKKTKATSHFEIINSSEENPTTTNTAEIQALKDEIERLQKESRETNRTALMEAYNIDKKTDATIAALRQQVWKLGRSLETARQANKMPATPRTLDELQKRIETITKENLNEIDGIETHVVMDLIREMENIINKPSIPPTVKAKCIQYREVLCYALSVTSGQTILVPIAKAIKTFMEENFIPTEQIIKVIAGISGRGPKVSLQQETQPTFNPPDGTKKEIRKTHEQTGRIILRATTTQELQNLIREIALDHFETGTENQPTRDDLITYKEIIETINTENQTQVAIKLKQYLTLIGKAINRFRQGAEIPASIIQQLRSYQF